jgi:hypothetical protein
MNRLPIRFEEEVLSKHKVSWFDECREDCYVRVDEDINDTFPFEVTKHELAGIALEAMEAGLDESKYLNLQTISCVNLGTFYLEYGSFADMIRTSDKDFCECIFKAVREIWK